MLEFNAQPTDTVISRRWRRRRSRRRKGRKEEEEGEVCLLVGCLLNVPATG